MRNDCSFSANCPGYAKGFHKDAGYCRVYFKFRGMQGRYMCGRKAVMRIEPRRLMSPKPLSNIQLLFIVIVERMVSESSCHLALCPVIISLIDVLGRQGSIEEMASPTPCSHLQRLILVV